VTGWMLFVAILKVVKDRLKKIETGKCAPAELSKCTRDAWSKGVLACSWQGGRSVAHRQRTCAVAGLRGRKLSQQIRRSDTFPR
jgi:hypothetical protein